MAVFRVQKNKDYTVMSNHHLRNTYLSLKAKGLLSLMLSLPENWDYTLHGLAYISLDGLSSIRAAVGELESAGYLKRRRLRNNKGQLTETEYTILEQPEPIATRTASPIYENPILDNPTLEKPILEKPTLENRMQLNTYISNKKELITDLSRTHQSILPTKPQQHRNQIDAPKSSNADLMDEIEVHRVIIHKNIEYEILLERYDTKQIDELVQLMLDAICSTSQTIRIDRADYPTELVKSRLLTLQCQHIEYVLECLDKNTTKIKNIRNYLLTALYNSVSTIGSYYQAAVNHDFYSGQ